MRIALFVPAPFATVSGGYNYDRAIVEGLRARGHALGVAREPDVSRKSGLQKNLCAEHTPLALVLQT